MDNQTSIINLNLRETMETTREQFERFVKRFNEQAQAGNFDVANFKQLQKWEAELKAKGL